MWKSSLQVEKEARRQSRNGSNWQAAPDPNGGVSSATAEWTRWTPGKVTALTTADMGHPQFPTVACLGTSLPTLIGLATQLEGFAPIPYHFGLRNSPEVLSLPDVWVLTASNQFLS